MDEYVKLRLVGVREDVEELVGPWAVHADVVFLPTVGSMPFVSFSKCYFGNAASRVKRTLRRRLDGRSHCFVWLSHEEVRESRFFILIEPSTKHG